MAEELQGIKPEIPKNEFSVKRVGGVFEVYSPYVELASGGTPIDFDVTLEKIPTKVDVGSEIEGIAIDRESPKLQEMLSQAKELRDIPERERPRKLLQLLRSQVHFAYDEVVDELSKTNPELAEWVAKNTGISSSSANTLKLSEIIDAGHGVCRHLSVAMLALADKAGMQGTLVGTQPLQDEYDQYRTKNVLRKDNGQPLFKMSEVGSPIGAHAWVELRTSDGEWIPVDPSTQLVGDTKEGMDTFREANYRSIPGFSLEVDGFPKDVGILGNLDLWFLPGEAKHTGVMKVNSRERRKPIRITFDKTEPEPEDKEQWPKPTEHKGELSFRVYSQESKYGMNVGVIDVQKR